MRRAGGRETPVWMEDGTEEERVEGVSATEVRVIYQENVVCKKRSMGKTEHSPLRRGKLCGAGDTRGHRWHTPSKRSS